MSFFETEVTLDIDIMHNGESAIHRCCPRGFIEMEDQRYIVPTPAGDVLTQFLHGILSFRMRDGSMDNHLVLGLAGEFGGNSGEREMSFKLFNKNPADEINPIELYMDNDNWDGSYSGIVEGVLPSGAVSEIGRVRLEKFKKLT